VARGTILRICPSHGATLFDPRYRITTIQTARGCPMECEFCSVTSFNGRRHRQRPVAEVLDELEASRSGAFFLPTTTSSASAAIPPNARSLCFRGMIERRIRKEWFCQASLNFADRDDVLKWAARSGCRIVFLGIEAENVEALHEVNKQMNLGRLAGTYQKAFRRIPPSRNRRAGRVYFRHG